MYSVILCGGSGTRLWPLSRKTYPKQFLKLYSDKSLLQETFLRMEKVMPAKNIYLVTNYDGYFNVFNQIKEIYPEVRKEQIIMEPVSLNTAPAIALALKYLVEKEGVSEDDPVIILPSDHYIGKIDAYAELVKTALANTGDNIGTLGITPTAPETGYGYIRKGEKSSPYFKVLEFKEKPDKATAEKYLETGEYVWNSGMYIFNEKTFSEELEKYAPELFSAYSGKYDEFVGSFDGMQSVAVDVAISEKSKRVVVFEGDFGWSDIGSFDALADIINGNGNQQKRHVQIDSENVFLHSSSGKLITALGVEDLIVVENNDAILIQKRGKSEDVKKAVSYLKENDYKEVDHSVMGYRPWGKYEVLVDEKNHKVKKITVYPGATLSLQSHNRRAEHWVVVKGIAGAINGDKELVLKENESTYVPIGAKHRLSNPGKEELEIIEVQTGDYLEEDDIVRYDDVYGRSK
ncbi:MAG: mannose-1-phosphate guanylyltransferase / phosphomannose isomerase, mannose-1-phosphate guanylyltransferase, mannose-6-phosphate isomerase [Parcubacteria group bacterium GW2011_GWC1_45_14]|nr:MAG: Mannose-1-phosphate guanylyltransferase/mannose-6-phosphate isomerase [Candidatus Moranbacteria bacterium GW2011_GWC2_45_10]KKT95086.1 MAG: mannose-1-phosphate guanylyltransferase / phosphomannose isomerase, mannose-1-phosphate guanylyltransferase, mannose-6-phosphate isomerase [Parcubacteria group bacterium GW2011_GWC1_45_14]